MQDERSIAIRWEGAFFSWHSLAHVNRELCLALLATGQVELSVVPTEREVPLPDRSSAALARSCVTPTATPRSMSGWRRVGVPSESNGRPGNSGDVASSTIVTSGEQTWLPIRPDKGERPSCTALPARAAQPSHWASA